MRTSRKGKIITVENKQSNKACFINLSPQFFESEYFIDEIEKKRNQELQNQEELHEITVIKKSGLMAEHLENLRTSEDYYESIKFSPLKVRNFV